MRKFTAWILSVPGEKHSLWDILSWWEIRRIPFNAIVGTYGIVCLFLFYGFVSLSQALEPGEDAVEPLAILISPILINICYTSGWVSEILVRLLLRGRFVRISRGLFLAGTWFSLAVVSIPTLWWAAIWLAK